MQRRLRLTKLSELRCSICYSSMPIARMTYHLRGKEHIKDMWCYRCKMITKHIENSDDSAYQYYLDMRIKTKYGTPNKEELEKYSVLHEYFTKHNFQ